MTAVRTYEEFSARSLFHYALLGLFTGARRVRAFIAIHALLPENSVLLGDRAIAMGELSAAECAVLGAVSFARRLEELVGRFADEALPPPAREAPPLAFTSTRELLR